MLKRLLAALSCTVLIGGAAIYFNNVLRPAAMARSMAANIPPPTPVSIVEARLVTRPDRMDGIGAVQAVHQVLLAPEVGGRVVRVFFDSGASVQANMPLVQINDRTEQADLQNLQAQAELAEHTLMRSADLASHQFATQASLDQNRALLRETQAAEARIQAVIAQKWVLAPFAGQIGMRQVELGEYLNPGGAVAVLTDLDHLRINFSLPEQARSRLRLGEKVSFTADGCPGRTFSAHLSTIDPQVSSDARTIQLQAALDNPDHALLPGMSVEASVLMPEDNHVVVLPETAIDYSLAGDGVYVIEPEGGGRMHARRVAVTTGERFDDMVVIRRGIAPGTPVVASGQTRLRPGGLVVAAQGGVLLAPDQLADD